MYKVKKCLIINESIYEFITLLKMFEVKKILSIIKNKIYA